MSIISRISKVELVRVGSIVRLIHSKSQQIFSNATARRTLYWITQQKYNLREYHQDTSNHCIRVGLGAVDLGYTNELSEEELRLLGVSGLFHDIGKIRVPLDILNNTGELSDEQWRIVERHTIDGFRILEGFDYNIRLVALLHHTYKTQNPYPAAEEIQSEVMSSPPQSISEIRGNLLELVQIISVVDMFDVLVHGRPYSPPKRPEEVERILRTAYGGDERYIDQVLQKL